MARRTDNKGTASKRITFKLNAPSAESVLLVGDFTKWEAKPKKLKRSKTGRWSVRAQLRQGRHEYKFLVDGDWKTDPNCETRVANPFGTENCVVEL